MGGGDDEVGNYCRSEGDEGLVCGIMIKLDLLGVRGMEGLKNVSLRVENGQFRSVEVSVETKNKKSNTSARCSTTQQITKKHLDLNTHIMYGR